MNQRILLAGLGEERKQLKKHLEEWFTVIETVEPDDTVSILMKQYRFIKVIVIGLTFFRRDSYYLLDEIQNNVVLKHIPVVCIGPVYVDNAIKEADYHDVLEHGGLAFFSQPVDIPALKQYIRNVIQLKDSSHYMNMKMRNDVEEGYTGNTLWNPRYLDSIIMQTAMGAVCLIECLKDKITILRTNEAFSHELTGIDEEQDIPDLFEKYLNTANRNTLHDTLRAVVSDRESNVKCELVFGGLNTKYQNLHVQMTLRLVEQVQDYSLIYCVLENDTDKYEAKHREEELICQLQIVIQHVNCGITVSYDEFGSMKYDYSNDRFYSIFGYTKKEFEEETIDSFRDLILPEYYFEIRTALNTACTQMKPVLLIFRARKKDNSVIWVKVRCLVHFVKARKKLAYITIYEDITHMKASEDRIKALNDQLTGYKVYIQLDLAGKLVEEYHSIYEPENNNLPVQTRNYRTLLLNSVYPNDKERMWEAFSFENLLDSYYTGNTKLSIEYRRQMPNGGICWFSATAVMIRGGENDTINAFIYAHDIDEEVKIRIAKDKVMDIEVSDITLINIASGMSRCIKMYDGSVFQEFGFIVRYDEIIDKFVHCEAVAEDRELLAAFLQLKNLIPIVEEEGSASVSFWIMKTNGINARKNITVTYLDSTREDLLMVGRDITELFVKEEEQQRALQHAAELADMANRAKSDFLSRMSHDMRTPLYAIIGMIELSMMSNQTKEIDGYLKSIDVSSKYLLTLINDTLDLRKIETGKMELHCEPYQLSEFIESINTVIKPLMDAKNIDFVINLCNQTKQIVVDKVRFNQIFFNLLSNAAKYTPEEGRVEFSSEKIAGKEDKYGMRFHIRDNGIGMSQEFQKVLFEPFSQEYSQAYKEQKGSGLGLAIVKQMVELFDGSIEVISAPWQGTEFIVEMYTYATDQVSLLPEKKMYDLEQLRGKKILLVDDNEINARIAMIMLQRKGCIVDVVYDGEEAISKFSESEPNYYDIILTDIRMPVMDGFEEARRIRALEREDALKIPIVAATADAYDEIMDQVLEAGMNERLIKPINSEVLYETVLRMIQKNP